MSCSVFDLLCFRRRASTLTRSVSISITASGIFEMQIHVPLRVRDLDPLLGKTVNQCEADFVLNSAGVGKICEMDAHLELHDCID